MHNTTKKTTTTPKNQKKTQKKQQTKNQESKPKKKRRKVPIPIHTGIIHACSQSTKYDLRLKLHVEAVGLKQTVRNACAKQQHPQNLLNQELGTSKTADSVHGGIFCKLLAYFGYMFRHLSVWGIIRNNSYLSNILYIWKMVLLWCSSSRLMIYHLKFTDSIYWLYMNTDNVRRSQSYRVL